MIESGTLNNAIQVQFLFFPTGKDGGQQQPQADFLPA